MAPPPTPTKPAKRFTLFGQGGDKEAVKKIITTLEKDAETLAEAKN